MNRLNWGVLSLELGTLGQTSDEYTSAAWLILGGLALGHSNENLPLLTCWSMMNRILIPWHWWNLEEAYEIYTCLNLSVRLAVPVQKLNVFVPIRAYIENLWRYLSLPLYIIIRKVTFRVINSICPCLSTNTSDTCDVVTRLSPFTNSEKGLHIRSLNYDNFRLLMVFHPSKRANQPAANLTAFTQPRHFLSLVPPHASTILTRSLFKVGQRWKRYAAVDWPEETGLFISTL